ncbi:MAG: N-acetylmuramic acid 6-phosphate etherase [Beijerinckiaceae bacterium]
MPTEDVDPRFADLDDWPIANAIEAMWEGHMAAVAAVRPALPVIAAAVETAAAHLARGGRLIYVGAGTSGRIAVQDGAELTPTFDWPAERNAYVMAGGMEALLASVEGAEDDAQAGAAQIAALALTPDDVVIGLAASGRTPFTLAAIETARARGAVTVGIANNAGTPLLSAALFAILAPTGSELIAGSTRMKAGTAQKIILNLISSGIMVRLGRIYRGLMVNVRIANEKLRRRASDIVQRLSGCDADTAARALNDSGNDVRLAVLIALGIERREAEAALYEHDGNLRHAIRAVRTSPR